MVAKHKTLCCFIHPSQLELLVPPTIPNVVDLYSLASTPQNHDLYRVNPTRIAKRKKERVKLAIVVVTITVPKSVSINKDPGTSNIEPDKLMLKEGQRMREKSLQLRCQRRGWKLIPAMWQIRVPGLQRQRQRGISQHSANSRVEKRKNRYCSTLFPSFL
jgi:hypothetical protein